MQTSLMKTPAAKCCAVSFILLILAGNFWLAFFLIGHDPYWWIRDMFYLSLLLSVGSVLFFLMSILWRLVKGQGGGGS